MPDFKRSDAMSEEEAHAYMRAYHATTNVLVNAVVVANAMAKSAPDVADREDARATALDAARRLELLHADLEAFIEGDAIVRAPTPDEVQQVQDLAAALARLQVADNRAAAVVGIVTEAAQVFNAINKAPAGNAG
jgi:hypothetical protein